MPNTIMLTPNSSDAKWSLLTYCPLVGLKCHRFGGSYVSGVQISGANGESAHLNPLPVLHKG